MTTTQPTPTSTAKPASKPRIVHAWRSKVVAMALEHFGESIFRRAQHQLALDHDWPPGPDTARRASSMVTQCELIAQREHTAAERKARIQKLSADRAAERKRALAEAAKLPSLAEIAANRAKLKKAIPKQPAAPPAQSPSPRQLVQQHVRERLGMGPAPTVAADSQAGPPPSHAKQPPRGSKASISTTSAMPVCRQDRPAAHDASDSYLDELKSRYGENETQAALAAVLSVRPGCSKTSSHYHEWWNALFDVQLYLRARKIVSRYGAELVSLVCDALKIKHRIATPADVGFQPGELIFGSHPLKGRGEEWHKQRGELMLIEHCLENRREATAQSGGGAAVYCHVGEADSPLRIPAPGR